MEVKKILVIRFRQIGDSILATALCNSLKSSFPNAEVHFVINSGIAPLYKDHPSIDRLITFSKEENKTFLKYISKVWRTVHNEKYDIIIDMRSTIRTLLFSLFSLSTPWRIGKKKGYTYPVLNCSVDNDNSSLNLDMVKRDLMFLEPLEKGYDIKYRSDFSLFIKDEENERYRRYMKDEGIDFDKPVVLVGVTTKILTKRWNIEFMKQVIERIIKNYPEIQLVFNYAKGEEEMQAREMFKQLSSPERVKIDIQASSLLELVALCNNSSFYFGNEGGARHMIQAMGVPSFSIFSPKISKAIWLPINSVPAEGIEVSDIIKEKTDRDKHSYQDLFDAISVDEVWNRLVPHLDRL